VRQFFFILQRDILTRSELQFRLIRASKQSGKIVANADSWLGN
jgi:hypothetical protein